MFLPCTKLFNFLKMSSMFFNALENGKEIHQYTIGNCLLRVHEGQGIICIFFIFPTSVFSKIFWSYFNVLDSRTTLKSQSIGHIVRNSIAY